MKFAASLARSLQADMQRELRDLEQAVAAGTKSAGQSLKTELRRQVGSAGLGQRLANGWRDRHYPNQKLDAASLVYTKAPPIIRAFDEGALIRSKRGRFLAIPTENAPRRGADGRRISPSTFPEHRFGPLRFVPRQSGPSLLVVDGLRASYSRQTGLNAAKNASRPFAVGTSSPAEGPNTAEPAGEGGLPCARGEPGADGRLCPYREHALISHQEHETWDVLLACQGQLRLAPSGHVIGSDMDASLRLAAARGYDLAVLSELLPAAEAGVVEALSTDRARGNGL